MRIRSSLVGLGLLALLAPAAADAESCVPGFDFAAFARDEVDFQGNATTNSYDSSVGTYASTNGCSDGDIGTNTTASARIHVTGASSTVCGDVAVGNGGTPSTVVTGSGTITGTQAAQSTNVVLTSVTAPFRPPGAPPNPTGGTIAPEFTYGAFNCAGGAITLDAGIYVVGSINLTSGCQLVVNSGPIELYVTTGDANLSSGAIVNTSLIPSNLVIYMTGAFTQDVRISSGATAALAVYAPNADCELQGNVDLYGALVCEDVRVQGDAHIHYDRALANFAGTGFTCPAKEVSRASPIVATIDTQTAIVQGTFEVPTAARPRLGDASDLPAFTFPFVKGHVRARLASSVTTSASTFAGGTVLFDAGAPGKIPPVSNAGCATFTGTCRNVFTVTQAPDVNGRSIHPPLIQLNDGNSSVIGALMAPTAAVPGMGATEWQTLVRTVLAGELGGVDRSTVAVIPQSPLAGPPLRPTVAYFGATDGMLHAVCAITGPGCPSIGTELWAFMPRVQLPLVRENTTRIDGSPRVVDAFGDFSFPATGVRSFRTILTFQTGYADPTLGSEGATYALDVSDPTNPIVVWEKVAPAAPAAFKAGVGLAVATAPVLVDNRAVNLTFVQTNNAGSAGPGVVLAAIVLETGLELWRFTHAYPTPPRGVPADLPLPATGIPGGAVAVDTFQSGFTSDIVMADLYGSLWRIVAETGLNRTGTPNTPIFRMSQNKKPIGALPAIYSDGNAQYAVFGTGGYADPVSASWSAGVQVLASVPILAQAPFPLDENSPQLDFKQNLAAGEAVFGQVLVVGNEVFVSTDSTDVNDSAYGTGGNTGHVYSYNMSTSTPGTTVVVRGGASSLANVGTNIYGSSSDQQQQLSDGAASVTGPSVDAFTLPKLVRRLWLRTQ